MFEGRPSVSPITPHSRDRMSEGPSRSREAPSTPARSRDAVPPPPTPSRATAAPPSVRVLPEHLASQPSLVSERCFGCLKRMGKEASLDAAGNCEATRYSSCKTCNKEKCETVPKRWRRAANIAHALWASLERHPEDPDRRERLRGYCEKLQKRFVGFSHANNNERAALADYEKSDEFKMNWERFTMGFGSVGECHPTNEVVDQALEAAVIKNMTFSQQMAYFHGVV